MKKRIIWIIFVLCAFVIAGYFCKEYALVTDFTNKNISPCIRYPFGTDWMGRNPESLLRPPQRMIRSTRDTSADFMSGPNVPR